MLGFLVELSDCKLEKIKGCNFKLHPVQHQTFGFGQGGGAYDLLNVSIANPEDREELALSLGGKKSRFNKSDFVSYGKSIGLTDKQIEGVFRRLQKFKKKGIQCQKLISFR